MNLAPDILTMLAKDRIAIIGEDDLSSEQRAKLPGWWREVLSLPTPNRMERALREWDTVVAGRFPRLQDHLRRTGEGVYLALRTGETEGAPEPELLYIARFTDEHNKDRPVCWAGALPLAPGDASMPTGMPREFVDYHKLIHDGLRDTIDDYGGILRAGQVYPLSEYYTIEGSEFRDVPDGFDPSTLDLTKIYAVTWENARGCAIDTSKFQGSTAAWYWYDSYLAPIDDYWDQIDYDLWLAFQ